MEEALEANKNAQENLEDKTTDESIPPTEAQTTAPTQNSEPMEVHHHPQLHHKHKPWKEYILEFIMIFLAVTLGFFAENIRERIVENKREEEYAHSLYNDLKTDTAVIQRTLNEKNWIETKYDSVQKVISLGTVSDNNEFIYYIERYLSINDVFTSQDVTYQQLRSSGGFRYIKNIALYKEIANYYNLYDRYAQTEPGFGVLRNKEMAELELNLFNISQLQSLDNYNGSNFYDLVLRPNDKLEQIKEDNEGLKRLYLKVSEAKLQTNYNIALLNWLKESATDILTKIKKEYHFK